VCVCAILCVFIHVHARVHVYTRLHIRVSMYILDYTYDKVFVNQITRTRVDFTFTHVLIPLFHFLLVSQHEAVDMSKFHTHMHARTYIHSAYALRNLHTRNMRTHAHTDISHTYITPPPPSFYRAGRVGIQRQNLVTIYTHVHIHIHKHTYIPTSSHIYSY